MSAVQQLISKIRQANNFSRNESKHALTEKQSQAKHKQMSENMKKNYRPPWKVSGQRQLKGEVMPLRNKELSNWQVARISLSRRSYCVPKNYKGIKISTASREFSQYSSKDKNGHLPYLYESDAPKLERIRSHIKQPHFDPVGAAHSGYFRNSQLRYSHSQPQSAIKHKSVC